jgi:transcriptional regulator with XRE-family HTH domain
MINSKYIAKIRKMNDWSQTEIAGVIGISRPTYIAIEKGTGDMTIEQLNKLANKLGCEPEDILTENLTDEEKYKQVLMEILKNGADDRDGKITKTKLAKLAYLADFTWYYQNLESMTGAKYRKLPQGPVPNLYFSAIDNLFDQGLINIEINRDAQMISLSEVGKKMNQEKLNQIEKKLIKKITTKWKNKRTNEIVAFTHDQLPYKICNPGEVIPYELITQQDPEDVY